MFISFCICLIFYSLQFTGFLALNKRPITKVAMSKKHLRDLSCPNTPRMVNAGTCPFFRMVVHPRRLTAGTYQNLQITIFFCKERDLNQTSMLMFQSLIFRGVLGRSLEDVQYLPKKKIPFIWRRKTPD